MSTAPAWVTLDVSELNELLARASSVLDEPDYEKLRLTVEGFIELVRLLEDKRMSIKRLRQMLFGARTEKTNDVLTGDGDDTSSRSASNPPGTTPKAPTTQRSRPTPRQRLYRCPDPRYCPPNAATRTRLPTLRQGQDLHTVSASPA